MALIPTLYCRVASCPWTFLHAHCEEHDPKTGRKCTFIHSAETTYHIHCQIDSACPRTDLHSHVESDDLPSNKETRIEDPIQLVRAHILTKLDKCGLFDQSESIQRLTMESMEEDDDDDFCEHLLDYHVLSDDNPFDMDELSANYSDFDDLYSDLTPHVKQEVFSHLVGRHPSTDNTANFSTFLQDTDDILEYAAFYENMKMLGMA